MIDLLARRVVGFLFGLSILILIGSVFLPPGNRQIGIAAALTVAIVALIVRAVRRGRSMPRVGAGPPAVPPDRPAAPAPDPSDDR